jgi:RNA-directed DNA polymerase
MLASVIGRETGVTASYIEQLARSASHFYKVYAIDKRHGDQKRIIQQPSRALKFLQRWIVANVIQDVPVHSAAAAYVTGSSVKKHAEKHVKNNYLLRLDFHQFFPSIKGNDIRQHLVDNRPHLHFVEEDTDIELLVTAVTRNGGLVIGAPSSPALSNQIMFQFDDPLHRWCADSDVTYTRYADDLYFSTRTPDVLRLAQEKVVELLGSIEYPKLSLNDHKTVHTSRKKKRLVTGLSLSSDGKVSLGRHKKREIRSMIHKHVVAGLTLEERAYLAGYLAYARSVEPQFIASLERKYGSETMQIVMTMSQPPRSPR